MDTRVVVLLLCIMKLKDNESKSNKEKINCRAWC